MRSDWGAPKGIILQYQRWRPFARNAITHHLWGAAMRWRPARCSRRHRLGPETERRVPWPRLRGHAALFTGKHAHGERGHGTQHATDNVKPLYGSRRKAKASLGPSTISNSPSWRTGPSSTTLPFSSIASHWAGCGKRQGSALQRTCATNFGPDCCGRGVSQSAFPSRVRRQPPAVTTAPKSTAFPAEFSRSSAGPAAMAACSRSLR